MTTSAARGRPQKQRGNCTAASGENRVRRRSGISRQPGYIYAQGVHTARSALAGSHTGGRLTGEHARSSTTPCWENSARWARRSASISSFATRLGIGRIQRTYR